MQAITDKRPRRAIILLERTADSPAPPAEAFPALLAVITAELGDAPHFVLARERLIVVQHGPGCRAEYRVAPQGEGSRVSHTLLNVAPRLRWAGALTRRRELAAAPEAFDRLVARMR